MYRKPTLCGSWNRSTHSRSILGLPQKNFLASQKKQWVDWPRRFAQHAQENGGDWDAYWRKVGLRDNEVGDEVGKLLRAAVGGTPARLLNLADDAAVVFDQAIKLADLPEGEFRLAWRALLKKTADQNLIVDLAGGEVEPILDALVRAEARRALFRAGAVVGRDGPQKLKDFEDPFGPFEYRELEEGFEVISELKVGGEPLKLVFGQSGNGA